MTQGKTPVQTAHAPSTLKRWQRRSLWALLLTLSATEMALAGTSPFTTGATAMSTNVLAILTPIAIIAVMSLGAAAWFNKIAWSWAIAAIVGICCVFGAPQIVAWIRGLFGV